MNIFNCFRKWLSNFGSFVIDRPHSTVTQGLTVRAYGGRYVLDGPSVNYAFGGLDVFFRLTFHQLGIPKAGTDRVLILGYGTGNVASLLEQSKHPPREIIGIEADPVMKALSGKYFQGHKLRCTRVIIDDAWHYAMQESTLYDLIVVDVFIDDQVPEKFGHRDFLKQLRSLLTPNGILLFNRLAHTPEAKAESYKFLKHFCTVLPGAKVLPVYKNLAGIYKR